MPGGEVCSQEAAEPGPTIIYIRMTVQASDFHELGLLDILYVYISIGMYENLISLIFVLCL